MRQPHALGHSYHCREARVSAGRARTGTQIVLVPNAAYAPSRRTGTFKTPRFMVRAKPRHVAVPVFGYAACPPSSLMATELSMGVAVHWCCSHTRVHNIRLCLHPYRRRHIKLDFVSLSSWAHTKLHTVPESHRLPQRVNKPRRLHCCVSHAGCKQHLLREVGNSLLSCFRGGTGRGNATSDGSHLVCVCVRLLDSLTVWFFGSFVARTHETD